MDTLKFEWDDNKAKSNLKKHNVSFEEAVSVFEDEHAILFDDPEHSDIEERSVLLGFSFIARLLIVCHCVREENTIRIISARKATKSEESQYADINKGW